MTPCTPVPEVLAKYAQDRYSQHGEDGMIAELLRVVGVEHRRCAEIGAWDGLYLSNTAALWVDDGWTAVLAEADPVRFEQLRENVEEYSKGDVQVINWHVSPDNVDALLGRHDYDLVSIDVDGDDYLIWDAMTSRPTVVVVEFNQSIPYWVSYRPEHCGGALGASARALHDLGRDKGYWLVGRSDCNLFFARNDKVAPQHFQSQLNVLLPPEEQTTLVTDYDGNPYWVGRTPPWGLTGYSVREL